jgi:SpoIVB peptidase S55
VRIRTRKRRPRASTLLASVALFIGGLSTVSAASPQTSAAPLPCPSVMPTGQLQPGMTGTGYTVSEGTTPQSFDVEILGVLPNGIAVGRDMIIVEVDSPAIDRVGGIWAGMSGSPVYIGDQLVGAVAWGLSFGPSKIGGLTPASDMMEVLEYTDSDESVKALPEKVALTKQQSARIARRAGVSANSVSNFERLHVPFSISGVSGSRLETLRDAAEREGLSLIPFSGASTSAGNVAPGGAMAPGDSFAAALSYGDITSAALGTATAVCGGKVLAFGHPFFFEGATTMGASQSSVITVIDEKLGAPYKIGTVDGIVGTVDQDRLAAIRAMLGEIPEFIDINSTVSALSTGKSRSGTTQALLSEAVPSLTFTHLFSNIDSIFDEIGPGSSSLTWTVRGTTESGDAWELSRSNKYTSNLDISYDSLFEMQEQMFTLQSNDFEDIEFTGVETTVEVDDEVVNYRITGVKVARNDGKFRAVKRLRVRRGDLVRVQVTLTPSDDSGKRKVELGVPVPSNARFNEVLQVRGGAGFGSGVFCFFSNRCADQYGNKIDSLDELISAMENAPTNDELRAMILGRRQTIKVQDSEVLDQVVKGRQRVTLIVSGGGGGKGGPIPID